MAKDPAFLFYSSDFLTGTMLMTFEDRGKYITLLSLMHQQGRMDKETIRLLVGNISVKLKSKFVIDENGLFYNERLELETEKRNKFTESRRNNGNLGGRPKETKKPNGKPKRNLKDIHKDNLMEDGNKNENKDIIIMPFESEKFSLAWSNWKKYRTEKKITYKPIGEQAALKSLSAYSEEFAIKVIEKSMGNGWQGLIYTGVDKDYKEYLKNNGQKTDQFAEVALQVAANLSNPNRKPHFTD